MHRQLMHRASRVRQRAAQVPRRWNTITPPTLQEILRNKIRRRISLQDQRDELLNQQSQLFNQRGDEVISLTFKAAVGIYGGALAAFLATKDPQYLISSMEGGAAAGAICYFGTPDCRNQLEAIRNYSAILKEQDREIRRIDEELSFK